MRIDAYMQVSQIYQANKTKNAPKTGKASDVREDKVKEIQAQMAAGTYSVSIEDVADKMADALLS